MDENGGCATEVVVFAEGFVRVVLEEFVEVEEEVEVDERVEEFLRDADRAGAALVVAGINEVFVDLLGGFVCAVGKEEGVGASEVEER